MGDSIVRWATKPLGTSTVVRWLGKSGARLRDLPLLLNQMDGPPPAMIIIHLGTNDLVSSDQFCIRQLIASTLQFCKGRYPAASIVWSDILPRVFYFGARSQVAMERQRRALNRWAKSQSAKVNARVLHHPNFKWSDCSLFRFDGVHLSPKGNQMFRADILACVQPPT